MQLYILFCWLIAVTMAKCINRSLLNGACPQPPVKADFELEKYLETWYEVEKNPTVFQSGQKCTSATYTLKDNGKVRVLNKAVIEKTGNVTTIEGEAYIPDPNEPAKLLVSFPGNPFDGNYWILDTDYEKYSVVFSCQGIFSVFRIEYLWILSRERTLPDTTLANIYEILDKNGITRNKLTKTDQSDC